MGAFADGFSMGQRGFQAAQESKRRDAIDAREAEAHKLSQDEGQLRLGGARRVDEAAQGLTNLSTYGVADQGAQQENASQQMEALKRFDRSDEPYQAPTGLRAAYKPATDMDMNTGMRQLAVAKGDLPALQSLHLAKKGIEWEIGAATHGKAWDDMSDDQRGALIKKLSDDAGVPGNGTWVPGKGKAQGYMNYLPPGGDPIKLSAREARQAYVLANMMEQDPTRARAEMDKASDKVAELARHAFDSQTKGVTVNNAAMHYANTDANNNARLGIDRERLGLEKDKQREMDPKDVKTLNDLTAKWEAEKDPAKKRDIEQQFRMTYSVAATKLNKVMGLPNPTKRDDPKEADIALVVGELRVDPANKGVPYPKLRGKAMETMTGRDGGGFRNVYGDAPENGAAAPTGSNRGGAGEGPHAAGLRQPPLSAVYGTPGYDAYVESERIRQNTGGVPSMAHQPVPDFSKYSDPRVR